MSIDAGGANELADLLEPDDFLSLTTAGPEGDQSLSTTSTSYSHSMRVVAPRIVWDTDHPGSGEPHVFTTFDVQLRGSNRGDVRVWNVTDSVDVHGDSYTTSGTKVLGPTYHDPATKSDPIVFRIEARVDASGKIKVKSPTLRFGVKGSR